MVETALRTAWAVFAEMMRCLLTLKEEALEVSPEGGENRAPAQQRDTATQVMLSTSDAATQIEAGTCETLTQTPDGTDQRSKRISASTTEDVGEEKLGKKIGSLWCSMGP